MFVRDHNYLARCHTPMYRNRKRVRVNPAKFPHVHTEPSKYESLSWLEFPITSCPPVPLFPPRQWTCATVPDAFSNDLPAEPFPSTPSVNKAELWCKITSVFLIIISAFNCILKAQWERGAPLSPLHRLALIVI